MRSESAGGIILLACVWVSLLIANSPAGAAFQNALEHTFHFSENPDISFNALAFINDGLMAIFFLMVGLEIKRELLEGELSSPKQAALPIVAAIGGMLLPALIYTLFNRNTATVSGWGIPMATDIAFAIGILSVLGKRVPPGLKVFLVGLAIADDLGAILVIAVFYTEQLHAEALLYAALVFALQIVLNRAGVKGIIWYLIPGVLLWYFIHNSGIHATIAGVLTAFTLPTNPVKSISPLERLEKILHKPVNFFIMPLFALANTNIRFHAEMIGGLESTMALGIIAGLVIGKPLGIAGFSWLAIRAGLARLPHRTAWNQMFGAACLGGIGFTMSIFIALLSFADTTHTEEAKFAILIASVAAGICGYLLLMVSVRKNAG